MSQRIPVTVVRTGTHGEVRALPEQWRVGAKVSKLGFLTGVDALLKAAGFLLLVESMIEVGRERGCNESHAQKADHNACQEQIRC